MAVLKRAIDRRLEDWLEHDRGRAVLVDGARQVGKTYAIRAFAKEHFGDVIEVNFIEDPEAARYLGGSATAADVLSRLGLIAGRKIEPGRTLVFFDEVQAAPEIVTATKFLVEDGRLRLALSGSLLGVELRSTKSVPVGYLRSERMFPLTFEEFCWSQGVPTDVLDHVGECFGRMLPVEETLHDRLIRLARLYLVIGGMPAAVCAYMDNGHDLGAVRSVQTGIVNRYRDDISQYRPARALQIRRIFDLLPSELAKENKRFQLKTIKEAARYGTYEDDFLWLTQAGVALQAHVVHEARFPLLRSEVAERFKLYSSDVGLLTSRYPQGVALDALVGARSVNFGAIYENFVAQELAARPSSLRYYNNNRKGEVDFLAETGDGQVVAIEVKSGKDYKMHVALNNLLSDGGGCSHGYVVSEANVSTELRAGKTVCHVPLYMVGLLAGTAAAEGDESGSDLAGFVFEPPSW